jgi:hypothetical protein
LLQVSLFTINEEAKHGETLYTQVLGGGKCHDLCIGGFLFAKLLTEAPPVKKITIKIGNTCVTPQQLDIGNLQSILEKGYSVKHGKFKITIEEYSQTYGKMLNTSVPVGKNQDLHKVLQNAFSFAMLDKENVISSFGSWKLESFSERQIKKAINPKRAIFSNGQIFVDLGMLLSAVNNIKVNDSDFEDSDLENSDSEISDIENSDSENSGAKENGLVDYLAGVFQVKEFLFLSQQSIAPKLPASSKVLRQSAESKCTDRFILESILVQMPHPAPISSTHENSQEIISSPTNKKRKQSSVNYVPEKKPAQKRVLQQINVFSSTSLDDCRNSLGSSPKLNNTLSSSVPTS